MLFDDIPGYPRGHRVVANILTSVRRINLTLGLPIDGSADGARVLLAQIHERGEDHPAGHRQPPGRCMENVSTGKDIDIQKIPTPQWHEHDGGYYIGTGCMVIMKDPDTGWINYGAYRVQSHGTATWPRSCARRASTAT